LLCTGQPFHPVPVDLGIAPSSRLTGRVSFLFRCQPSPATSLGVVHPALREELPQEIPVAHPPTRVLVAIIRRRINMSRKALNRHQRLPGHLRLIDIITSSPVEWRNRKLQLPCHRSNSRSRLFGLATSCGLLRRRRRRGNQNWQICTTFRDYLDRYISSPTPAHPEILDFREVSAIKD